MMRFMGFVMEEQFNVTRNDGAKKYEAPKKASQEIRISLSRLDALIIIAWIVSLSILTAITIIK